MILESGISNDERSYRNFRDIVTAYCPEVDIDTVKVTKTPKGNWKAVDSDGNKLCLVSRNVISDELVDARELRYVDPNESN